MKLKKFIEKNYKSQADFARKNDIQRAQVTQWLNKDTQVINGKLYSFRRDLKN